MSSTCAEDSIQPAGELNSFLIQLKNDQVENVTSYYAEGLQVCGAEV